MILVQSKFPEIISKCYLEKRFGLVTRGGKTFVRNYGRVLKNGKGMNVLRATYAAFPIEILPMFKKSAIKDIGRGVA